MNEAQSLRAELELCAKGIDGWAQFEVTATKILTFLFVPPLEPPTTQARSYSGIDRRDAVFPNRNFDPINHWGKLYKELGVRMLLVEFKNYAAPVGKDESIKREIT